MKKNDSLKMVLQYQAEVATTENRVAALESAIAKQQQAIEEATNFTTDLPSLVEQRENLLAAIATGESNTNALAALNAEIEAKQKQLDSNNAKAKETVAEAQATIAGLKRKLEAAQTEVSDLASTKSEIIKKYLMSEAELLACDYVQMISNLAAKLSQLRGLGELLKRYGGRITNNYSGEPLAVPMFNLQACTAACHRSHPGWFKAVVEAEHGIDLKPFTDSEIERVKALGVAL